MMPINPGLEFRCTIGVRCCLLAVAFAGWQGSADESYAQTTVQVPAEVAQAEQQRIETIERIAPSVVAIFAPGGEGGGSGVVISPDGFVVTNFHVVQGLGGFMKCGLNDGQVYDAVLVGIDPTGDVALIQLLGRTDFPHATIGDSDAVQMGDWTYALGNPFLLADDFQPTVTYGMVSGTHRYQYPAGTFLEYTDCIQVDTSINPGNSGGPLFNEAGELIGINGRISVEKRGRVNVGAGYAISINQVMFFLDHLKSGRIVDHATLGATVTSTSDGAVIVANILESSAAFRRGLRQGDELIAFAGRPVRSVNQFKNILGIYPKGWQVPLAYQRDGQRFDIVVRLAALHRQAELAGRPAPEMPGPDDQEDPEQKRPQLPIPHPQLQQAPEIPDEFKHLYVDREGFANFHFNQVQQDALLKTVSEWGAFGELATVWALDGTLAHGAEVLLRMRPDAIAIKIDERTAVQRLGEDWSDEPTGSGGLLAAMQQLKQMLIDPHDYFTEIYYLGSEPFGGDNQRVDVLMTSKGTLNSRWYFAKDSGKLLGFDTSIESDQDACEIRFGELGEYDGLTFPQEFVISVGGEAWGTLAVESLRWLDAAEGGQES